MIVIDEIFSDFNVGSEGFSDVRSDVLGDELVQLDGPTARQVRLPGGTLCSHAFDLPDRPGRQSSRIGLMKKNPN